jgi:carboxylesterase type B
MYRFDYPSPAANYGLGSCHGAEIPFVFDTLGLPSVRPRLGSSTGLRIRITTRFCRSPPGGLIRTAAAGTRIRSAIKIFYESERIVVLRPEPGHRRSSGAGWDGAG